MWSSLVGAGVGTIVGYGLSHDSDTSTVVTVAGISGVLGYFLKLGGALGGALGLGGGLLYALIKNKRSQQSNGPSPALLIALILIGAGAGAFAERVLLVKYLPQLQNIKFSFEAST